MVEQGNRAFEWGRFANRPYENVRECGPLKTERHEPLPRAARVVGATGGESGVTRRVVAGGAIPVAPGPWRARYPAILSFCASPVKETYTYNNRLQVSGIQLSTPQYPSAYSLTYNYSLPGGSQPPGCPLVPAGSGNNGNVIGYTYTDTVSSGMNHSALYVYDTLNRLACAQATGSATYNLAFTYDRYGNMACQTNGQTNGPCPNWTFNSSANQITTAGYTYDAAGNVTSDNLTNYQWDAEGRLKSVNNGAARSYVYNALGREAEWHGDGRVSEDLTDLAGHYLGSVDPSSGAWTGERIPGSRIYLAWYVNGGTTFFHYNALGSSIMNTHQDGNTVSNDVLFYPWGQLWASPVNDYFQFFGNIEGWDWEIGEGVTPNRYYPNYQGRWLTPDRKRGNPFNPQSWNRYAYVLDNPINFTDPYGLWTLGIGLDWGLQGAGGIYNGSWGLAVDQNGYVAKWNTKAGGLLALGTRGGWLNVTLSTSNAESVNGLKGWGLCGTGGGAGANWIGGGGSACMSIGKGPTVITKSAGVGIATPGKGAAGTVGYTSVTYLGNINDVVAGAISDGPDPPESEGLTPNVTTAFLSPGLAAIFTQFLQPVPTVTVPLDYQLVDPGGDTAGDSGADDAVTVDTMQD